MQHEFTPTDTDDSVCALCPRAFEDHNEIVGISNEDEKFGDDFFDPAPYVFSDGW